MSYLRVRFKANGEDPRPVVFPPSGPYWISGYSGDSAIIVAYVKRLKDVKNNWPEAEDIQFDEPRVKIIHFSERFAKPDWWVE